MNSFKSPFVPKWAMGLAQPEMFPSQKQSHNPRMWTVFTLKARGNVIQKLRWDINWI